MPYDGYCFTPMGIRLPRHFEGTPHLFGPVESCNAIIWLKWHLSLTIALRLRSAIQEAIDVKTLT